MREIQELIVQPRPGTGKGPSYQTRLKGLIPAIIYGGNEDPETIAVDGHSLELTVEKGAFLTTLLTLKEDGGKVTRVIPRALQLDPVTDRPVHVDFMRLPEGATVRLNVPVRVRGQEKSPGLKRGGVLNIVSHTVELVCPAEHIPEYIDCDVSVMDIRDSLHISSIALPEGVRPVRKGDDVTLATIVAPTTMREETKTADAAPAAAAPAAGAKAPAAKAPAAKAPEKK